MGGCRRMVSYGEVPHMHSTSSTPLNPTSKHCASPFGRWALHASICCNGPHCCIVHNKRFHHQV